MCGLLVYYQKNGITESEMQEIQLSLQTINHRGPDGEGITLVDSKNGKLTSYHPTIENIAGYDLVLAHKRLSIFDLSAAAAQPMISNNDGVIVVFNGEIYNFIELKNELLQLGHTFSTNSDTEVIIKSYKAWGTHCIKKFNGMWAFILYDLNTKKLFVSRDRFGIKPLNYHCFNANNWVFFSEEKQLFPFKRYKKTINKKAVEILLKHNLAGTNNETFYQDIYKYQNGHFSYANIVEFSPKVSESYFEIVPKNYQYNYKNKEFAIDKFNSIFNQSMDYTLRADVPVGLGFSGGVDSSRIVYECYQNFQKPETFSAVFPNKKEDESYFINLVKEDLNLKSNFCFPENEFSEDDFRKLTFHLDAPVPSLSYYAQWCVSRLVNQKNIKVLLVGQGADEVFAGYHHHFYRYLRSLIFSFKFKTFYKEINAYTTLKSFSVKDLKAIVWSEIKLYIKLKLKFKTDIQSKMYLSSSLYQFLKDELLIFQMPFYLQADDRIGMAFNFESRYPFLDHELVDFGFQCSDDLKIQNGWQKWIIRQSNSSAPSEISWRKDKVGYVMPNNQYNFKEEEAKQFLIKHFGLASAKSFLNYSVYTWAKQYIE